MYTDALSVRVHDVFVREILKLVIAIGQLRDLLSKHLLGVIENVLEQRLDRLKALSLDEFEKTPLDQLAGAMLRIDVRDALFTCAHVILDQRHHRPIELLFLE